MTLHLPDTSDIMHQIQDFVNSFDISENLPNVLFIVVDKLRDLFPIFPAELHASHDEAFFSVF